MGTYPIVGQRELRRSFWWNSLRQRRRPLAAGQDEVLVYQIGTRYPGYVTGTAGLAPGRRVTAVCIVDVSRDVLVSASCQVTGASSSGSDFRVQATFRCTVISPATVARNRHTHAIRNLSSYLSRELSAAAPGRAPPGDDGHHLRQAFTERLERRSSFGVPGLQVTFDSLGVAPEAGEA